MLSKKILLIVGIQGSGKGTQSMKLSEYFNIPHLRTGELLREEVKRGTSLGFLIKENLDRGELVPDSVIESIIQLCLSKGDVARGFIFDGFPRNYAQSVFFMDLMKGKGYDIKVIYLEVSDKEAIARMSFRAREDDVPGLIKRRLSIFHAETAPLIDYFKTRNDVEVIEVDGELSVDGVFNQIICRLGNIKYDNI